MDRCRRVAVTLVAALAMTQGCSNPQEDTGGTCLTTEFSVRVNFAPARSLDMVVVIDDSSSMADAQQAFVQHFPAVLRSLLIETDADGDTCPEHHVLDDLRLAVLTPNLGSQGLGLPGCNDDARGDDGCFQRAPAPDATDCAEAYPAFLALERRDMAADSFDRLVSDAGCLAARGTQGCGIEQPLSAALRALTTQSHEGSCNAGFRRPDVPLAVIFLTDEDDGSLDPDHPELLDPERTDLGALTIRSALHPELLLPVADVFERLWALAPPLSADLFVGMIVGVPSDDPGCLGSGDQLEGCLARPAMSVWVDPVDPRRVVPACCAIGGCADPARRFVDLARRLGSRAEVTSICAPDRWESMILDLLSPLLVEHLPMLCFPWTLPFDPETCRTSCVALETLSDDRPCPPTADCPQAWCPPATAGDAAAPAPCTDPVTGRTCNPLRRDLGTVRLPDGSTRRQCLVRQAERVAADGACGPPVLDGWYHVPADAAPDHCPRLALEGSPPWCSDRLEVVEPGSDLELRCWRTVCADRSCGPPEDPSALECPRDEYCARAGDCRPAWE